MTDQKCEICGVVIRGPSFTQHARACARRPIGAVKKLYPIALPEALYNKFRALCVSEGQTLGERVWQLIREDVRVKKNL